jgi:MFS family permease
VLLAAKLDFAAETGDRIGMLALIASAAAGASLFAAVFAGHFSDRTRGRFGMRTPWIVGSGLVAGLALLAMAVAEHAALLPATCGMLMAVSAQLVVTAAVIPDRAPVAQRGTLSAAIGVGQLIGMALGLIAAAQFIVRPDAGLAWIALVPALSGVLFALIAPEAPNHGAPPPASSGPDALRSLLPPRGAPDFYRAVAARFFLVLGTSMILNYQLYIVTDHLGQDAAGAAATLSRAALIYVAGAVLGGALGGPLSDRLGRRKPLVFASSLLIGGSVLLMAAWAQAWAFVLYKAVNGFGFGIYLAVHGALCTEVLPNPATRGKDIGFVTVATRLGGIVAPSLAGAALSVGGYAAMFIASTAFCIGSITLIVPIRSVR